MRALVLVIAVLLSAGSMQNKTAEQRHRARMVACGNNLACRNTANTQYAVESQREMHNESRAAEDQRATAAETRQLRARCDAIVGNMMQCRVFAPDQFAAHRDYCMAVLADPAHEDAGRVACVEQARDCDQLNWCLGGGGEQHATPPPS